MAANDQVRCVSGNWNEYFPRTVTQVPSRYSTEASNRQLAFTGAPTSALPIPRSDNTTLHLRRHRRAYFILTGPLFSRKLYRACVCVCVSGTLLELIADLQPPTSAGVRLPHPIPGLTCIPIAPTEHNLHTLVFDPPVTAQGPYMECIDRWCAKSRDMSVVG